jgi:dTDP-4-dehydrorhamnose reductase
MHFKPMKLAWITGANGLIGTQLLRAAPPAASGWRVRPLTRADFDLLDFAAVERQFKVNPPQLILHCAAITTVVDAQKDPALARRVNVEMTRFLAEMAAHIPFVFFSTDLVFDGRQGNYTESDTPNPLHVYGETKLLAEAVVLKNPRHLVVRTSINAGRSLTGDRAFNEQLRRSLQRAGPEMTLFMDEFRCPLPAVATARAVWELAQKGCSGIYHVAGVEKLSRWEIGRLLIQRWPEAKSEIKSGSAKDFSGPPRAFDTSLDVSKAQKILVTPLPKFSEWLAANPAADI